MRTAKRYAGVVVEKDGKFWGVQYEDGHSTAYGFGPIENAGIHDPQFCKRPADVTYQNSPHLEELATAILRPVVKTVIFEVEGVS